MEKENNNVCPSSIYAESQLAQTKRNLNQDDLVSNDMLSTLMRLSNETAEMGPQKRTSRKQHHLEVNRISRVYRIDATNLAVANGNQD